MKRIKAIVVDDEEIVRELLKLLLERHCPQVELIGEAHSIESAYREIKEKKPELVFLDIQMPKGDGFSLLKKFDRIFFEVIFTTSYNEYAIQAIKVQAVDYLLKPYDIKELKSAVQKVIDRLNLVQNTRQKDEVFIQIHKNDKVETINSKNILFLEAKENYTLVTTMNEEKYLVARTLSDFNELLSATNSFIRIHRSVIVNMSFIKSYSKVPPYTIVMDDETAFEISRRRRGEIIDILRSGL
jgi:two-component system LytT family response regulator